MQIILFTVPTKLYSRHKKKPNHFMHTAIATDKRKLVVCSPENDYL